MSSIYEPLIPFRDSFVTCLAMPVANVVVLSFWAAWFVAGPSSVLPGFARKCTPNWVNQSIHTVPLITNLFLISINPYQYPKKGYIWSIIYSAFYIGLAVAVKYNSGYFPYPFLEKFNKLQRLGFFLAEAGLLSGSYLSHKFLGQLIHGRQPDTIEDIKLVEYDPSR